MYQLHIKIEYSDDGTEDEEVVVILTDDWSIVTYTLKHYQWFFYCCAFYPPFSCIFGAAKTCKTIQIPNNWIACLQFDIISVLKNVKSWYRILIIPIRNKYKTENICINLHITVLQSFMVRVTKYFLSNGFMNERDMEQPW